MSARSDGIEAFDKGDDFWLDNPYEFRDPKHEEWADGWKFSQDCDAFELD